MPPLSSLAGVEGRAQGAPRAAASEPHPAVRKQSGAWPIKYCGYIYTQSNLQQCNYYLHLVERVFIASHRE